MSVPQRKKNYEARSLPLSATGLQQENWQRELAQAIRDPAELLRRLDLPDDSCSEAARQQFSLKVTEHYLSLIRRGDDADPLLRQVLPADAENHSATGFTQDPVGDGAALRAPGLLHKYQGRALLISTPACAVHCRYCFRRHYPYPQASAHGEQFEQALAVIAADTSLSEIILSGGDPLSLSDARLQRQLDALAEIPHLKRLRIHSRLPVALPSRITERLCSLLGESRLQPLLVLHSNHPNELCDELALALTALRDAGVTLLNQSVLLRNINDNADTLCRLSERLFEIGVLPYYLHQLDRVAGAAHFAVDRGAAFDLHRRLQARLPGYLLPRLVEELPGADSKQSITAQDIVDSIS